MPGYMMTLKDLQTDIKIGIKTKGYEDQVKGSNLLVSIGFIGRCTNTADDKVIVKLDEVVKLVGTRGVKMVKPETFRIELLAGQELKISDFLKKDRIKTPQASIIYKNSLKGETTLRFLDYTEEHNSEEQEKLMDETIDNEMIDEIPKFGRILTLANGTKMSADALLMYEVIALRKGQITEDEILVYDSQGNIIVVKYDTTIEPLNSLLTEDTIETHNLENSSIISLENQSIDCDTRKFCPGYYVDFPIKCFHPRKFIFRIVIKDYN